MYNADFLVPFVYILAAIFYALVGLYAWRKRPAVGVVSFAWVMLSMSIWSLTYALEIFLPTINAKLQVLNIEYLGILGVPVFLFFFALDFTGRSHLLTPRFRLILWGVPAFILLMVWTNPLHSLMWGKVEIFRSGSLSLLSVDFRSAFWVNIIYTYGLVIAACIILIMEFLQRPGSLRLQISFVILSLLASLLGSSTFVLNISPIVGVDLSPLFFLPAAIGLAWVTLRYRLAEILSLEHITVLQNMKDSVIVLNETKKVIYINQVTEKLFNLTEDKVIGQPFNFVSGRLANLLDPYISPNEQYHNEIEIGDGEEKKTYEVSISPIVSATRNTSEIIIALHDITLRKEKELELSRHGAIMSAVSRAAEQFLKTEDWEQNISNVLENLGQAADVSRVSVKIEPVDNATYEWKAQENPYSEKPLSQVVFPVFVNGIQWATISFDEFRYDRQWSNMELEAFQTAVNILAAAETRTQTVHQLNRRQLALGLLQDIATVSLQAANLNEMAEVSAERLAKLIKADGCYLTLWNDVTKHVIPVAAYGTGKETYARTSAKEGEKTFTQSSLELEKTLIVEDVYNTSYASASVVSRFPAKSLLILPLIALEKKLGAVLVSFETPHRFIEEEVQICEQAASLIALALEKFQAMDEAQRRANTSESLRRVGIAVAEQTELKQAVNYVLEKLKQMVPYDSASVQLRNGDELYIIGGQGWGDEQEIIDLRFPIPGDNPNTVVIERGSPYYLPDAGEVYKQFRKPPHNHIRSWLGIPLLVQEKIIGLLAIDSAEPNDFSEQEIMIATEFANQVAVTLENARILKETQTQAVTDPLTGISNRRGLIEAGKVEFSKTHTTNRPFSAIMLDLDYFKSINDTYGHAVGDLVLREFAKRCKSCIREIDYIGRYGGEEFIILLPDAHMKASMNIAERLRSAITKKPIRIDDKEISISASLGVACRDENTTSLETLIARADQALYIAKHNGRNCVAVSH